MTNIKPNTEKIETVKHKFEDMFRLYFAPLTYYAQKFVVDHDTAKDIVHEVFIKIWEKQDEIDWNKSLKSYLFTSVHNKCINYLRDNKKTKEVDIYTEILSSDYVWAQNNFFEEQELVSSINDAMNKLPDRCKEIFLLNRFDGLKYAQVAEKLNISVKTVEAQMSKALKILREELIHYLKLILIWIIINLRF